MKYQHWILSDSACVLLQVHQKTRSDCMMQISQKVYEEWVKSKKFLHQFCHSVSQWADCAIQLASKWISYWKSDSKWLSNCLKIQSHFQNLQKQKWISTNFRSSLIHEWQQMSFKILQKKKIFINLTKILSFLIFSQK